MDLLHATPIWMDKPEDHDFPAAGNYLSLLLDARYVTEIVKALKKAETVHYFAKDILRASRLSLLPIDDTHVAEDLAKIIRGEKLSPVLLVRGKLHDDAPLTIADGYHRVCTGYHLADNTAIPCRIVDLPDHHDKK
ncbi:MAG TPA: hypothetical protein DCQ36_05605 [Actinobacteria bacterium]|jgi:hypothetical protein|nr:hypothetical protein [Actinomycetota bacterium]